MKLSPAATLSSSVNEGNRLRREFYSAEWEDQILRTRPQDRCTLNEVNRARKESYDRRYQVSYLEQRSPNNWMRMGLLGEPLTEYRLPYRNLLPLPIFKPAHLSAKVERAMTPPELAGMMELERALGLGGICEDKREIAEITRELPPVVQPVRVDGKKPDLVQRSLSRSLSYEAQRG